MYLPKHNEVKLMLIKEGKIKYNKYIEITEYFLNGSKRKL